jgi:transmembrane sensor
LDGKERAVNKQLAARAEAAAWITRLHGPNRTPEMEAGFHRWLSESPENRAEFEGLTDIWAAVGTLPAGGTPRLERWEHSAESRELQQLRRRLRDLPSRWSRNRGRRATGLRAALAVAACVIVVTVSWFRQNEVEPTYATDVGEQRVVQLADKSRIWMNSETRVRIAFDNRQRQVELVRGEALFEVTKEAPRPFVVVVGGHRVTALGTSFVIRYESDHAAVTLVDGKVAIDSPLPPSGRGPAPQDRPREKGVEAPQPAVRKHAVRTGPWVLSAGQRLTFEPAGVAKIDVPSLESVLAWRRGEVVLNDTPLEEAVSEMNHYDKTPLVIEGPALARLTVSGLYHTGDNEGFARSIAKMYHLDLEERDGRIYLKPR